MRNRNQQLRTQNAVAAAAAAAAAAADAPADPYALRTVEELPDWMHFNRFVLTGYRVAYTPLMCLRSFFMLHNESLNIWTHACFLAVILAAARHLFTNILAGAAWHHHAIFLLFLLGNVSMLLFSTTYHLFGCCSHALYDTTMFLDYFGISLLLVASFIPGIWFAFACHPEERAMYLVAITLLGSLSLVLPWFKVFDSPEFTPRRIALYSLTGASGVVPALHTLFIFPHSANTLVVHTGVALMFVLYALGVLFYVSKFPESRWPGRFDLVLHSHQIWHVCVGAAAVCHFFTCIGIYQRFTLLTECHA